MATWDMLNLGMWQFHELIDELLNHSFTIQTTKSKLNSMKTHNLGSWIGVGVDIPTWCVTSNIVIFKRIYFKGMVNSLILELFLEIFYGEKK